MYVFGGSDSENRKLNDMWKFDVISEIWEKVSYDSEEVPRERSGHSCDLFGHFLVIFGGFYDLT